MTKLSSGNEFIACVGHSGKATEHFLVCSTQQLHAVTFFLKSSKGDKLAVFAVHVLINLPAFISFPYDCTN